MLEEDSFSGRSIDYLWMLTFGAVSILVSFPLFNPWSYSFIPGSQSSLVFLQQIIAFLVKSIDLYAHLCMVQEKSSRSHEPIRHLEL